MQEKVFAYLRQWNMVKPGDTVLVGFSGGADSTALLQLLWNYGRQVPLQLEAVHVNHGIRGAEALREIFRSLWYRRMCLPRQPEMA